MTTALTTPEVVPPVVEAVVPAAEAVVPAAEAVVPAAEAVAPTGAPDAYADFAFPEGFDATQLNVDEIKAFAKELDLPQDKAQKVAERVIKQRGDFETAQATARETQIAAWADEAKADKEIGGDNFDANLALARSVIENPAIVDAGLKTFLDESGLGNHPEMIRTFHRIAKLVGDDGRPVPGGNRPAAAGGVASMYDNPSSKHS